MATKKRIARNDLSQRTIPAGEFKTHCLSIMDEVAADGREVVITKHGKPIAKLVPATDEMPDSFGVLRGTVTYLGDIVSSDPDDWPDADD